MALFTTDASLASVTADLNKSNQEQHEFDFDQNSDEINNFAQLINQLRNGARLPSLQCSPHVIYRYTIHVSFLIKNKFKKYLILF